MRRVLPLVLMSIMAAGCGTPTSPVATSFETRPLAHSASAVLSSEHPAFKRYNQHLNEELVRLAGGPITGMFINPKNPSFVQEANNKFYRELYLNDDLMGRTQDFIGKWIFSTANFGAKEFHAEWQRVVRGDRQAGGLAGLLREISQSRKQRWERLASKAGMPVPKAFQLYRGASHQVMTQAVYRSWEQPAGTPFAIPLYVMSSWSLDENVAVKVMEMNDGVMRWKQPWVVFKATVPFESTLLDKCQGSAIQIHLGSAKRIQVKSLTEKHVFAQLA